MSRNELTLADMQDAYEDDLDNSLRPATHRSRQPRDPEFWEAFTAVYQRGQRVGYAQRERKEDDE